MGYTIDRERAIWDGELVAVLAIRQRGSRSRLLLIDGSIHDTRTRPGTLANHLTEETCQQQALRWVNDRRKPRNRKPRE